MTEATQCGSGAWRVMLCSKESEGSYSQAALSLAKAVLTCWASLHQCPMASPAGKQGLGAWGILQRWRNADWVPTPTARGGNDFDRTPEVSVLYLERAEIGPTPGLFLDCLACLIIYCIIFNPPGLAHKAVCGNKNHKYSLPVIKKMLEGRGFLVRFGARRGGRVPDCCLPFFWHQWS